MAVIQVQVPDSVYEKALLQSEKNKQQLPHLLTGFVRYYSDGWTAEELVLTPDDTAAIQQASLDEKNGDTMERNQFLSSAQ